MKINFKLGALALVLAALTACTGENAKPTMSEWLTYSDEDEKYGFFNPGTGEKMYEGEFDERPTSIIDGVFIVSEKNGISVYTAADSHTPRILGDLEELKDAGGVSQGFLPVCRKNSRIEVYAVSAKSPGLAFTLDPVNGKEITECYGQFYDGLLVVQREDNKMGVVDTKGQTVIDFEYDAFGIPANGVILTGKVRGDGERNYYAIDYNGNELFKLKKGLEPQHSSFSENGYFAAKNEDTGRCVLVNKKGETFSLPKEVAECGLMNGQYMVFFNSDDKAGVIRINGEESEVVLRAKYELMRLLPWDPTKCLCSKDGDSYMVIDLDGNKLVEFDDDYRSVDPFYSSNWKGFIATEKGRAYEGKFFDAKGEKIKFPGDFCNIDYKERLYGYVQSDYFNVDEFAKKVSAAITPVGLCGYKAGDYANRYYTSTMEPSNYTYTYWFTPAQEPDVQGYKFSSEISLSTARYIGDYTYDYYSYSSSYYFNPNNPLDGMKLTISGPTDLWERAGAKIKSAIKAKGFSVEDEYDSKIVYRNANGAKLEVSWSSYDLVLFYFKSYEVAADVAVAAE